MMRSSTKGEFITNCKKKTSACPPPKPFHAHCAPHVHKHRTRYTCTNTHKHSNKARKLNAPECGRFKFTKHTIIKTVCPNQYCPGAAAANCFVCFATSTYLCIYVCVCVCDPVAISFCTERFFLLFFSKHSPAPGAGRSVGISSIIGWYDLLGFGFCSRKYVIGCVCCLFCVLYESLEKQTHA